MVKTKLILLLIFLFSGFLNAQTIESKECDCDSILKAKIEARVMFAFVGRTIKTLVKPDNYTCETGKFSIDILVNRNGDVIQADFSPRMSSKISDNLKSVLIDAAMKSKFKGKIDAPSKQKGNITYEFRLKDKN